MDTTPTPNDLVHTSCERSQRVLHAVAVLSSIEPSTVEGFENVSTALYLRSLLDNHDLHADNRYFGTHTRSC